MGKLVLIFVGMLLVAMSATAAPAEPTNAEVRHGIKEGVIFAILPEADGSVAQCRYSESVDLTGKPDPNFKPSPKFIAQACREISNGKWAVRRDTKGKIKEVFTYCAWSVVIPDSPICQARLAD